MTIPRDVLDFLDVVQSKTKGYTVYLGGGYIRDLYFNQVVNKGIVYNRPKDIDIFFVPQIFFNSEDTVREIPVIAKTYINYDTLAQDIPDMQVRGVSSVRGMFVKGLSTSDVQFIIYDKVFVNGQHLAMDMDMNINQIMYDIEKKEFHLTEAFIKGHEDKKIECLYKFDELRMYKRYKRMKNKFPMYDVVTDLDMAHFSNLEKREVPKRKSGKSSISFVDD